MKDYSKPIGWWCPTCDITDTAAFNADGQPLTMGCHGRRCIPVFAVIPEGQRHEAAEPDEDTVCVMGGVDGETLVCAVGSVRRDAVFGVTDERHEQGVTLADAVLWVAEGRLP